METKLTLRLDDRLVARAKSYARALGISLSQLTAALYDSLEAAVPGRTVKPTPRADSLRGALRGTGIEETGVSAAEARP